MDPIEVVKACFNAVENKQNDKYASLVSDDFVFAGPVPQPIGKREFIPLQFALVEALPDWKFNATDIKQMGDQVTAMVRITGTHTGTLDLPMPGFMKVPPTGKKVSLPPQFTTFTVKNGKLSKVEAEPDPKAGVMGILSQLGISMPQM